MYRELPRTIAGREKALRSVSQVANILPPEKLAIPKDLVERLEIILPEYSQRCQMRAKAEAEQVHATKVEAKAEIKLKKLVSHFIQVFNFCISREIYKPSDRVFYKLESNSTKLPYIHTESKLLYWAENIVMGEKLRIKDEGAIAMVNPSAQEVENAMNEFVSATENQMQAKETFAYKQSHVNEMFTEVDELIKDIWDEIDYRYRKEPASKKRRLAREYGVVYLSRKVEREEAEVEEEVIL